MSQAKMKNVSIGAIGCIRTIGTNGTNRCKLAKRYIEAQMEGGSELYQRLRSNRYRMVLIGRRLFTVESPRRTLLSFYYAHVKPFPRHRGTQTASILGAPELRFPATTFLYFRLNEGRTGSFKKIQVIQEKWRRGWATDMVNALLKAHPEATWQNEVLNGNSGPLFERLSNEHPERIAPVSKAADGRYAVGSRPRPSECHRPRNLPR
ncbi:hypothetical protein AB0N24_15945 [Arthrobacter sp. NPDC093128]|uniref:hypothetical protein n=1 Tax=Arthrobacter sp. NPDC093128 TaxID=3154979 RepID=UPI00342FE3AF